MIRVTPYGRSTCFFFVALALLLAGVLDFVFDLIGLPIVGYALAGALALVALWVVWFFRDPERTLPGAARDIVAPADGVVTDATVGTVDSAEYIDGKAHVLGIFLNVFNVHVNRAPLAGTVEFLRHKQGKYLDARHPDCGRLNEQQVIGMAATEVGGARVVIKQIAGLIARRIVCPLTPGTRLGRGERFGMIKFGSRTELWIEAAAADVEWLVKPGDKVEGGLTIVGRITPKTAA